jgi:hypothetical protein
LLVERTAIDDQMRRTRGSFPPLKERPYLVALIQPITWSHFDWRASELDEELQVLSS